MTDHRSVAHRWATRWEVNGRRLKALTGFRMFSDGDSIFSHGRHFEIARYLDTTPRKADAGQVAARAVLFTDADYSVSTSKHKSITRRAIPSHVPVFTVPILSLASNDGNVKTGHAYNLASYERRAAEPQGKALRARTNGPWLIEQAESLMGEAERYARAFGVKWSRPELGDLAAKLAKADAAQRKAANKARKEREAREAIEREARRERDAADFAAWQRGETARCPHSYSVTPDGAAYIRRSPDGAELQTSQGAAVPWEHALRVFRFVKLCRERGQGWERNGHSVRVGHYVLDSVSPDGSFRAGCHRIGWEQIAALAASQGVQDAAPSDEAVTPTEGAH